MVELAYHLLVGSGGDPVELPLGIHRSEEAEIANVLLRYPLDIEFPETCKSSISSSASSLGLWSNPHCTISSTWSVTANTS